MFAQKLFEPIVHSHSWQQWKCLKNSKFMWFLLLKNSCRFLKEDLNPLCTVTVDDSGNFWRIPKSSDFYDWRILGDSSERIWTHCAKSQLMTVEIFEEFQSHLISTIEEFLEISERIWTHCARSQLTTVEIYALR